MPKYEYKNFFPYEKIRQPQVEAIEFAIDKFESGEKVVLMELPTGVGKSAIAITIARYFQTYLSLGDDYHNEDFKSGSYVLTTQKLLQDQYLSDFAKFNDVSDLRSSSNYSCGFYKDQSCGESMRLLHGPVGQSIVGSAFFNLCSGGPKTNCKYALAKRGFLLSPIGVTNFSYFFASTAYTSSLPPKDLLVVDECHNIEKELSSFIEVSFSEKFAKNMLDVAPIKAKEPSPKTVFTWLVNNYKPKLVKYIETTEKQIETTIKKNGDVSQLSKKYTILDKHICKVNRFIEDFNDELWVMNITQSSVKNLKKFDFKPVLVSSYGGPKLFNYGRHTLLMSATIVDKDVFCESIGLHPAEVSFIKMKSPFPKENRPVIFSPVGSMSMKNIDNTLPKLLKSIEEILNHHPDEKGIIHCTNYKIANYIVENIRNKRLRSHNSENRVGVLENHKTSKDPLVLVSPSMTEGVDLKGELSRFQILCKVPFPYLGDKAISKKMKIVKNWYPYETAKTIIQSLGRSIRNENDYAVSYILDSDWSYFFNKNKNMFPYEYEEIMVT